MKSRFFPRLRPIADKAGAGSFQSQVLNQGLQILRWTKRPAVSVGNRGLQEG